MFTSKKLLLFLLCSVLLSVGANAQPTTNALYSYRENHDPDGIGKFYQGREIAEVMGHQAADWLDRPERLAEERPDLLLQAIALQPGDVVADIGAGTGYLSWRMAEIVGSNGLVYANDIQQEMLDLLARNMAAHHATNFHAVLGTITNAQLPASTLDLAIMVDVYHEFDHPYEMMQSITRALKPGGRIVWVEYRAEDPDVPIKPLHKMAVAQVRKEAALLPLQWVQTLETLPRQHIVIFRRVANAPAQIRRQP